jgi:hypothetical protein
VFERNLATNEWVYGRDGYLPEEIEAGIKEELPIIYHPPYT